MRQAVCKPDICVLVPCTVVAPICENNYSGSSLRLEPNISNLVLCCFDCNLVSGEITASFRTHYLCWRTRRDVNIGASSGAHVLCVTVQVIGGLLFLAFGVHALYEGIFSSS